MLIKPVYDLIGAFGIVGGDHLGTVGTVEKQHANYPSLIPGTSKLSDGWRLEKEFLA